MFVSNVRLLACSVCLSLSLPPMLSCGRCASSLCKTFSGYFHFMFTRSNACMCMRHNRDTFMFHTCWWIVNRLLTFAFIYFLCRICVGISHCFATSIRTLWQATFNEVSMLPTNPASARYGRPGIVRRDGGSGCCLCGAQVCVVPWSQTGPCLGSPGGLNLALPPFPSPHLSAFPITYFQ